MGYLGLYLGGTAGTGATVTPPTPPTPIATSITASSPAYVDRVASALSRLAEQFKAKAG